LYVRKQSKLAAKCQLWLYVANGVEVARLASAHRLQESEYFAIQRSQYAERHRRSLYETNSTLKRVRAVRCPAARTRGNETGRPTAHHHPSKINHSIGFRPVRLRDVGETSPTFCERYVP
jgi:hypothetical protein